MNRKGDDLALLILRLFGGLGAAYIYGLPAFLGLLRGDASYVQAVARVGLPFPALAAWLAAVVQLVGGMCIAFGLLTRVWASLNALMAAVAAFVSQHAHLQLLAVLGLRRFPEATLQAWGSPGLVLADLTVFTALALMGAGAYSVDGALVGGRPPAAAKGRKKRR